MSRRGPPAFVGGGSLTMFGLSLGRTLDGPSRGNRAAGPARPRVRSGGGSEALVRSLQRGGVFSRASLSARQVADPRSLPALRVNGADLSMDHGFPARIIVPAAPGAHNRKWVRELDFRLLS
ncbi:molybdopterin-dependent oxidoreductase [Streptosporangium sp. NPDC002524]|uniref:molybdopterin-dependent oxidoreductase n=1 Tax=Streptosporangium sp. NPDC002524 TaxID=3154537 RepID=UPI00332AE5D8